MLNQFGFAETEPIVGVSLDGSQAFTMSVQFYARSLEGRISLAKQNIFELGIEDGIPYFYARDLGERIQDNAGEPIHKEMWNTLCVTYDRKMVTMYLNGVKQWEQERSPAGAPPMAATKYQFGSGLKGYLRYARIYQKPVTAAEAAVDQLGVAAESEQVALCLDFSLTTPEDKGKHHKKIEYKAANPENAALTANEVCRPVHIVRSLTGKAIAASSKPVCKVLTEGSFTIYAKVMKNHADTRANVVLACMRDSLYGVSLSLIRNGDTIKVGMRVGDVDYTSHPIPCNPNWDWIDVMVSYNDHYNRLNYFINNVMAGEFADVLISGYEAQVQFGNKGQGEFPLDGRIDTVALFDVPMGPQEIIGFMAAPPYLFLDHLTALYSFHESTAAELVSGEAIVLEEGAAVDFCETRQSELETGFAYDMQGEFTGTEYEAYLVDALAVLLDQYLPHLFGTAPAGFGMTKDSKKVTGKAANLLCEVLGSMEEAKKLADAPESVTEKDVQQIFQRLAYSAQLNAVLSIFCPAQAAYMSAAATLWKSSAQDLLQAAAKQALQNVVEEVKKGTKPQLTYQVEIQSIRFARNSKSPKEDAKQGAIPVSPLSASVWTPENSEESPSEAVYVASVLGKTVTAEVTFQYTTNDGLERRLELNADSKNGCLILGNGKSQSTVTKPGIYTAAVQFESHGLADSAGGGHYNPLSWSAKLEENEAAITGTKDTCHMLHVLADFPAAPWDVTDPKKIPPLCAVQVVSQMIAKYAKDIGKLSPPLTGVKMATYATYWLHNCGYFRADPTLDSSRDMFADLNVSVAVDWPKLMAILNKPPEKQTVNSKDCAALIASCTRLAGFPMNVVELFYSTSDPVWIHFPSFLATFFNSLTDYKNMRVFDGCYSKPYEGKEEVRLFAANLLFSQYNSEECKDDTESYYRGWLPLAAHGVNRCYPKALHQ